jgi:integrase/recombinase XerD
MKGRRYLGERRSMPLSSWPEQDRLAWEEALRPGDLFDQPSVAADWSPARRRIVVQAYGYWLMWLSQRDILDPNRHAGDRISTILIAEFVNDLNQRVAPASVGMLVGGVKRMLEAIAPDHDWQWMRPLYRNLKRAAVPTRQKHTRVVEAAALFELGVRLFQEAEATPSDRRSYLIVARNGLIISLLAARPIRLGNLVSIEIGRHLVRSGGLYRLVFSAQETKVGRPIDLHCPAELTPYIDKYLEVYRPLLLARAKQRTATRRLWINKDGGVLDISAIHHQIKAETKRAFGRPINPHLFRDCAATSIAIHDPEHVRIATAILGHTCVSTTNKHYNQAQMLTAAREHNREILRLRGRARSWRSRRPRKTE